MKRTFGIRQLGFFVPLVEIEERCFYHKNNQYYWTDIIAVKRDDDAVAAVLRFPSTVILLRDGTIIRLPARLVKKTKDELRFSLFSNRSSYKELINEIEKHSNRHDSKYLKYLLPCNYLQAYRMLITVGLCMTSLLVFLKIVSGLQMNRIATPFSLGVALIISGIAMQVSRHLKESHLKREVNHSPGH